MWILIMREVNEWKVGNVYVVVGKFQGRRGNQATRSLTEWRCRTGNFGTVEIEMCVLHVRHFHNGAKRYAFGIFSALWVAELP